MAQYEILELTTAMVKAAPSIHLDRLSGSTNWEAFLLPPELLYIDCTPEF